MFTQDELKQAVKQMEDAQKEDRRFGRLASQYLNKFLKNCKSYTEDDSYYGYKLYDIAKQRLAIPLGTYDDWHKTLKILEQNGVVFKTPVKNWDGKYKTVPMGTLDLTAQTEFSQARQKQFRVCITYHDSGWF